MLQKTNLPKFKRGSIHCIHLKQLAIGVVATTVFLRCLRICVRSISFFAPQRVPACGGWMSRPCTRTCPCCKNTPNRREIATPRRTCRCNRHLCIARKNQCPCACLPAQSIVRVVRWDSTCSSRTRHCHPFCTVRSSAWVGARGTRIPVRLSPFPDERHPRACIQCLDGIAKLCSLWMHSTR